MFDDVKVIIFSFKFHVFDGVKESGIKIWKWGY